MDRNAVLGRFPLGRHQCVEDDSHISISRDRSILASMLVVSFHIHIHAWPALFHLVF